MPSSSALDPLEGFLVFQIWRECRSTFGDTNSAKKFDVRIIFFRLGRLKTLVLKNHIVREVGCFPCPITEEICGPAYIDFNPSM